jgi:hypothetical protein
VKIDEMSAAEKIFDKEVECPVCNNKITDKALKPRDGIIYLELSTISRAGTQAGKGYTGAGRLHGEKHP